MHATRRLSIRSALLAIAGLTLAVVVAGPVSAASAAPAAPAYPREAGVHLTAASTKAVPDVVGKTASVAKATLKKAGLRSSYAPPKGSVVLQSKNWTVTKQSPKAGVKAKAGTKVKLTVVKTSTLHAAKPTTAATPSGPAAPALTVAQQQAVLAARGYLNSGMGFSRQGLIEQLTSSYGNGFTVPDATTAVDSLNPDWNAQAVVAAKGYLASGMGFSHDSLIEQLTSSFGNAFTPEQAAYAAAQVGL